MQLTTTQLQALKSAIEAETDAEFVALRSAGATGQMADWLNGASTFIVWRTELGEHEITSQTSSEATSWSWSAFIGRSQGERDGWARMFNGTYTINPSLANVRAAVADVFSGAGGAGQRAHCLAMAKRAATRGERVFATGTGTTATPGLLVAEGSVTDSDVIRAMGA